MYSRRGKLILHPRVPGFTPGYSPYWRTPHVVEISKASRHRPGPPLKHVLKAGDRRNRLTFIKDAGHDAKGNRLGLFRCSCEIKVEKRMDHVCAGHTKSCGCIQQRYGQENHPLYSRWKCIKARCHNPKDHNYKTYGGRGISMYPAWKSSSWAFIAYIEAYLGPPPSTRHTLDRINNNGNYEPGNLRWATPAQQNSNRTPHLSKATLDEIMQELRMRGVNYASA